MAKIPTSLPHRKWRSYWFARRQPDYLKLSRRPNTLPSHSGPEVLRHRFNVRFPPTIWRTLHSRHFAPPSWKAKPIRSMCAYNAVRGDPACAKHFLFDTLPQQMGLPRLVVSDCWPSATSIKATVSFSLSNKLQQLAVKRERT